MIYSLPFPMDLKCCIKQQLLTQFRLQQIGVPYLSKFFLPEMEAQKRVSS